MTPITTAGRCSGLPKYAKLLPISLESLRPDDRDIGNNFAYFATVTGLGNNATVARIAQANFEAKPDNHYYRSTWAFVLCGLSRPADAMRVIEPVASDWRSEEHTSEL